MISLSPQLAIREIRDEFPRPIVSVPTADEVNPLGAASFNARDVAAELFANGGLGYVGLDARSILPLISLKEHRA